MAEILSLNDVKVALNEVLKDSEHVELAVLKALTKYDNQLKKEINQICEKNIDVSITKHKLGCSGRTDKKPYYLIVSIVVERILQKLGIS